MSTSTEQRAAGRQTTAPGDEPRKRNRPAEFTERDGRAIEWMAEQYGARLDVLSVLLGRLGPSGRPLSKRATRDQIERWVRADLVRVERTLGQSWITPTRRGLDRVGADFPVWAVPITRVRHCHAVNVTRLWWEAQSHAEASPWVSERRSFKERGKLTWHIPDGVVKDPRGSESGPARHIAIEVELTHKTPKVYAEEVFGKLRSGVESLMYFAPDDAFAQRLRADLSTVQERMGHNKKWRVELLPVVPGVDYMQAGR